MKIMFLCHGNICRSPLAEFVMKDLVRRAGREDELTIDSAAVSSEEIGNPVYSETMALMRRKGIPFDGHRARKITAREFADSDIVVVMDKSNLRLLANIVGVENVYSSDKVHLLMEFAGRGTPKDRFACPDVADPWYTRDFEKSYEDILAGCRGLLSAV